MKVKRSNWKVPFMQPVWLDNLYRSKRIIKLFKRNSIISRLFINKKLSIYNGKMFVKLQITKDMIRHKYGEFSLTKLIGYRTNKKKQKKQTLKKK